jgi:hypothetical protein
MNFHANEVPFSTFGRSAAYLTGSWPADAASASLSLLPSVKDLTSDAFRAATCSRIDISGDDRRGGGERRDAEPGFKQIWVESLRSSPAVR